MWKRERGEIRNLEIISLDVAFVDKWFKPKVKSAMISQGFDSIFKKNWQKMPTEEGVAIVQSAMGMPQVRSAEGSESDESIHGTINNICPLSFAITFFPQKQTSFDPSLKVTLLIPQEHENIGISHLSSPSVLIAIRPSVLIAIRPPHCCLVGRHPGRARGRHSAAAIRLRRHRRQYAQNAVDRAASEEPPAGGGDGCVSVWVSTCIQTISILNLDGRAHDSRVQS
jgi:hypothetical protein